MTIEFLQKEQITVAQEITDLEKLLLELLGQPDFLKTKTDLDAKLVTHSKSIETWKSTKMDRERDDYINKQVYNWSEPNRFRARFNHPKRNQQLSTTNLSMTSTGSSTNAPR